MIEPVTRGAFLAHGIDMQHFLPALQDGSIAEPKDKDATTINRLMCKHFELVAIHGNGLSLLEDMLVDVYMPLLAYFEHRLSYSADDVLEPVTPKKSVEKLSSKGSEDKVGCAICLLNL